MIMMVKNGLINKKVHKYDLSNFPEKTALYGR